MHAHRSPDAPRSSAPTLPDPTPAAPTSTRRALTSPDDRPDSHPAPRPDFARAYAPALDVTIVARGREGSGKSALLRDLDRMLRARGGRLVYRAEPAGEPHVLRVRLDAR